MKLSYVVRDRRGFLSLGAAAAGEAVGALGGGIFNADLSPGGCVDSQFGVLANVRRELAAIRNNPARLDDLTANPDWRNQLAYLRATQTPIARGGPPGSEEAFDCPQVAVEAAVLLAEYDSIVRTLGLNGIPRDQVQGVGEAGRLAGNVPSQGSGNVPVFTAGMGGGVGTVALVGAGLALAVWLWRDR